MPGAEPVDWDAEALEGVRERLARALDDLAAGRYPFTPGEWCRRCDFVSFCPAGRKVTGQG